MKNRTIRPFVGLAVCALALAPAASAASTNKAAASKASAVKTVRAGAPGSSSAVGSRSTLILGAAGKSDNTPIPNAKLRLRDVVTGRIEATTVANDMGQFAFTGIESGTYAIELVSDAGKILTLGHTFTVAPGETVATFVRLGTKVPWFNAMFGSQSGFVGNAAAAASSTAASMGVTAVAPTEIRAASAASNVQ